ncbi:helix-turn-helix domain-containing protein [Glycomyces luteolus]|uniref:Helix-turn-helix domain-containing protein n=1 Tax=Glycomyces luteolus TaxID=2670330 RepID=A0A9X3SQH6_9ACTN|nr:ArsR family transcriptional regulator [Glycomyces luteolus]MDA1358949.1 helix-turn-helix domain-containing protein [Glycomyces luteolus]
MRELPHPATEDIRLSAVMHALSDEVRLELVRRLSNDWEGNCTLLSEDIEIHKSTLSHHYRVLRESGVTRTRVDGRDRHIRINREALDERFPGLLDAVLKSLDD